MFKLNTFLVFYFVFLSCMSLQAQKISESLLEEAQNKPFLNCILEFKSLNLLTIIPSNLTKEEKARLAFRLLKEHLEHEAGTTLTFVASKGIMYRLNNLTSSIFLENLPKALLSELAKIPGIQRISNNPTSHVEKLQDEYPLSPRSEYSWGLIMTRTDSVHRMNIMGQNAVIGGNDTGFDWTHPLIQRKYRGWNDGAPDHNYNWHDGIHANSPLSDTSSVNPCGLNLPYPCDDNSHGTHTMGTMTGSLGDSLILGMAPEAKWIATRNMERGNGSLASYLECLEWFLAPTDIENKNPKPELAPDVINNSWYCSAEEGCNPDNWHLMLQAVDNLVASGVVVVISAGNDGPGCETIKWAPNISENAIIVGATAPNDTIARFSSRGLVTVDSTFRQKPDVSAPGVYVMSSIPGNKYAYFSGTSMAGPHVTGLVALLISANPLLRGQVDTIKSIIQRTAVHKFSDQECTGISGMSYPNPVYGYGRIDALAAVEAALAWKPLSATRELNALHFSVYPNPVSNELYVKLSESHGSGQIEVFNGMGRRMITRTIETNDNLIDISLENIPPGLLVVRISMDNKTAIQKIIKL